MSETLLKTQGFDDKDIEVLRELLKQKEILFNPMQEDFLKGGFVNEDRVIVATPTASGKTTTVYLKYLSNLKKNKRRMVYTVPYNRIRNEFSKKFGAFNKLGILSTVEFKEYEKGKAQIFVTTYSYLDYLLLSGKKLESDMFVFDEVDMVTDDLQGIATESAISRIIRESKFSSVFALSATIGSNDLIQQWLSAKTFVHNYRPVKIEVTVKEQDPKKDPHQVIEEVFRSLDNNKQPLIVFYYNTTNCRNTAVNLAEFRQSKYGRKNDEALASAIKEITLKCDPTSEVSDEIKCISNGVAFYYSKLQPRCKEEVESLFEKNVIDVLFTTPALARGVNLPIRTVVIPSPYKYVESFGMVPISRIEIEQMFGRAGRPPFQTRGLGVLFSSDKPKVQYFQRLMTGNLERISSKLLETLPKKGRIVNKAKLAIQVIKEAKMQNRAEKDLLECFKNYLFMQEIADKDSFLKTIQEIVTKLMEVNLLERNIDGEIITPEVVDIVVDAGIDDLQRMLGLMNIAKDILDDKIDLYSGHVLSEILARLSTHYGFGVKAIKEKQDLDKIKRYIATRTLSEPPKIEDQHRLFVALDLYLSGMRLEAIQEEYGLEVDSIPYFAQTYVSNDLTVIKDLVTHQCMQESEKLTFCEYLEMASSIMDKGVPYQVLPFTELVERLGRRVALNILAKYGSEKELLKVLGDEKRTSDEFGKIDGIGKTLSGRIVEKRVDLQSSLQKKTKLWGTFNPT
jgi:replicative superfamily II helicase